VVLQKSVVLSYAGLTVRIPFAPAVSLLRTRRWSTRTRTADRGCQIQGCIPVSVAGQRRSHLIHAPASGTLSHRHAGAACYWWRPCRRGYIGAIAVRPSRDARIAEFPCISPTATEKKLGQAKAGCGKGRNVGRFSGTGYFAAKLYPWQMGRSGWARGGPAPGGRSRRWPRLKVRRRRDSRWARSGYPCRSRSSGRRAGFRSR
jgi:hypothetical protein